MVAQLDMTYLRARPGKSWSRLISYALFEGRPLTTRGRWINPAIFAHFAATKRLPQLARVTAPIFIIGTGRSGTTILGKILSMHRDIGFLNEPKAMWHAIHPGEDLIGSYSRGPARYRLGADDASPDTQKAAHRLYGAYLRASLSRRVCDKYPEMIFRHAFLRTIFPDAKFVFLSRGGWDTCASIEAWSARRGTVAQDWWGLDRRKWQLLVAQIVPEHLDLAPHAEAMRALTDQRAMAAVEWIVTMRVGLALAQNHPENVIHIAYEELCQQPRTTAQRIAQFTALRTDETFLHYAEARLHATPRQAPFALPDWLAAPFKTTQIALGHDG